MRNVYYLFSVKDKLFTELSEILAKENVFDTFNGLAYAKIPALKSEVYKQVSYVTNVTSSIGEVDYQFLEKIEQDYDIGIAEMIHVDRHISRYPKDRRLYIAQEIIKVFINDMITLRITHVFPEGVDDFISYFAAHYCEKHKIKFFYPVEIGYAEKACFATSIYPEPENFTNKFQTNLGLFLKNEIDLKETKKELERYVQEKSKPKYYLGVNEADYRTLKLKDFRIFLQYIIDYLRDRKALPYDRNPLLLPYYRLNKIFQKIYYKNLLKKVALNPAILKNKNINYFVYPLHFEPEASILIQGRWLNDQRKIIEMISKNLPVNTVLLVKEHRISIGRRTPQFYKDIIQYHNVFIIDDRVDTYPLIENSKGVIVISSTMGLEALMLQKPVMSFGERFYNVSNNVYVIDNVRNINTTILKMLNHNYDYNNLLVLLYTLISNTENLGTLDHFKYTYKDLEILANVLKQKHELIS